MQYYFRIMDGCLRMNRTDFHYLRLKNICKNIQIRLAARDSGCHYVVTLSVGDSFTSRGYGEDENAALKNASVKLIHIIRDSITSSCRYREAHETSVENPQNLGYF